MEDNTATAKPALAVSLALSGGAAKGSFHLGFVQAMQENGIVIKAISGSSVGALVGGALACGMQPKEILDLFKSKEFRGIFKFNWFRKSFFHIDLQAGILDKIFPLKEIQNTKIPFFACITDMHAHELIYADEGEGIPLIAASCALIPFFKPIYYEQKVLADGGIMNLMPTKPLLGYDYPIVGINLLPVTAPVQHSFFALTRWALQLLFSTNIDKDSSRCRWYISPKELEAVKMFSLQGLQKGFDLGYEHGLHWCKNELALHSLEV